MERSGYQLRKNVKGDFLILAKYKETREALKQKGNAPKTAFSNLTEWRKDSQLKKDRMMTQTYSVAAIRRLLNETNGLNHFRRLAEVSDVTVEEIANAVQQIKIDDLPPATRLKCEVINMLLKKPLAINVCVGEAQHIRAIVDDVLDNERISNQSVLKSLTIRVMKPSFYSNCNSWYVGALACNLKHLEQSLGPRVKFWQWEGRAQFHSTLCGESIWIGEFAYKRIGSRYVFTHNGTDLDRVGMLDGWGGYDADTLLDHIRPRKNTKMLSFDELGFEQWVPDWRMSE